MTAKKIDLLRSMKALGFEELADVDGWSEQDIRSCFAFKLGLHLGREGVGHDQVQEVLESILHVTDADLWAAFQSIVNQVRRHT